MRLKPEQVEYLVVHCSATTPDMDIGSRDRTAGTGRWAGSRSVTTMLYAGTVRWRPGGA
jgi:hypothetical protein